MRLLKSLSTDLFLNKSISMGWNFFLFGVVCIDSREFELLILLSIKLIKSKLLFDKILSLDVFDFERFVLLLLIILLL